MPISCACGGFKLEALGTHILCVVCYCDDGQEGARQIGALPKAPAALDFEGGTLPHSRLIDGLPPEAFSAH